LSEPLSHCARLVRSADHDRFLTGLFAPARLREHLYALYAFNVEISRIPELVVEPMLGEIRLQWWREAIDAAYDGGEPYAHPVAIALSRTIRQCALPRGPFDAMIAARELDLAAAPPASLAALEQYALATSSGLTGLAARVLAPGDPDPAAQAAIDHAGIGVALTGLIRSIGFHARAGRVYLPRDLMIANGLTPEAILARRMTAPLRQLIVTLAGCAQSHLAAATAIPRLLLPAVLPASLAKLYLRQIFRNGFDPFQPVRPIPAYRRQIRLLWAVLFGRL